MKTYCFLALVIKDGKDHTVPILVHGQGSLKEAVEAADLSITASHGATACALLYFEGLHTLEELRSMPAPEINERAPGPGWRIFILDLPALRTLDCYPEEKGGKHHAK